MAASGPRKKFANSNLNTLLGAPKESAKANYGPAVRSGGVVKPVAKPKGLVSLGKAPASSTVSARKGAAWNQLEEEAKKRAEEESAKKQDDSRPDWVAQEEEEVPPSDEPRELPTASGSTEELQPAEPSPRLQGDATNHVPQERLASHAAAIASLPTPEADAQRDARPPPPSVPPPPVAPVAAVAQPARRPAAAPPAQAQPAQQVQQAQQVQHTPTPVLQRPPVGQAPVPIPAVASRSGEVRHVREEMQVSHFQPQPKQPQAPVKVETSKPIEVVQANYANYAPPVRSGGASAVAKPKGLVSLGKAPATSSARKDDSRPSRPDWIEHEESEVSPSRKRTASGSSEELGPSDVQGAKHVPQERPERPERQNDLRREVRDARPPPPSVPPPHPAQQVAPSAPAPSAPTGPWARRGAASPAAQVQHTQHTQHTPAPVFHRAPVGQMAPVRDAPPTVTSRSGEVPEVRRDDGGYKEMQSSHFPQPKQPQAPQPPIKLESLMPEAEEDVSEVASGDEAPPEHAVLDLMVPRTALVINISHVLKRLNGCCSLNQLTKQIRSFKEKTGMSLEAFLRANPMTFKLEGRIVYLVDRDGEKWTPPKQENPVGGREVGNADRGKGKGKSEGKSRGDARDARDARGKSGGHKGDPRSGENHRNGKGARGKSNGEWRTSNGGQNGQWSGWDEWQDDWQEDWKDEWQDDWKANNWKGSW